MARHGMTISDDQVRALRQLFATIDRGGDAGTAMRSEPVTRFRAALQRIEAGKRHGILRYPCLCGADGRAACPRHGSSLVAERRRQELIEKS